MKQILMSTFFMFLLLGGRYFYNRGGQIKSEEAKIQCRDCNIIVISLSNLRKKNMSFYGYTRPTTPNIDNFFKDSFVFNHAIAPASITYTDATSFFFSLQPTVHRYMSRDDRESSKRILRNYRSFPKILHDKGYKTAAFVSDEDYRYENIFGPQFDYYFDRSFYTDYGIEFKPWQYNIGTKDLVTPTINWLRENHSSKFFLFFQAYDMHCPYTPRGRFQKLYQKDYNPKIDFQNDCFITYNEVEKIKKGNKDYFKLYDWKHFLDNKMDDGTLFGQRDLDHLVNLYDAELTNADDNLSNLFTEIKKLGLSKNTIIIFMSEHGDYLGESGYYMKVAVTAKGNLHNANLSYPLMIQYPPLKKSFQQNQMIQTIDLAPTILNMVGIQQPSRMQGKSFLKILGNNLSFNDYAFSPAERKRDFRYNGKFIVQALQNQKWKYNYYEHQDFNNKKLETEENLYDLINDPEEKIDLKDTDKKTLSDMREIIQKKRQQYEK